MIIDNYSTFRAHVNPGGTLAADGLPEFPVAQMRATGFDGGFVLSSTNTFPIVISCNANVADVGPADQYDWYVSQRTSESTNKPIEVVRKDDLPTSYSGRIEIDLMPWAGDEYPDPFGLSTIPVLFFAVDIYAIERTNKSIQRLDLATYLYDANAPKTNIE
jgi:hypothetical protein